MNRCRDWLSMYHKNNSMPLGYYLWRRCSLQQIWNADQDSSNKDRITNSVQVDPTNMRSQFLKKMRSAFTGVANDLGGRRHPGDGKFTWKFWKYDACGRTEEENTDIQRLHRPSSLWSIGPHSHSESTGKHHGKTFSPCTMNLCLSSSLCDSWRWERWKIYASYTPMSCLKI